MKKVLLGLFISLIALNSHAQEDGDYYKKESMVILLSTKDYAMAKAFAEEASQKLAIKLDLRGLTPDKQKGLTFSKADCEESGDYPCYYPRNSFRTTAGEYISIEYSSAYDGFAKNLYIVVAANGDNETADTSFEKVKRVYADAYVKETNVHEDYTKEETMLILLATKNYATAKKFAAQASKKLRLKLDLRGLTPNENGILTYSKTECEENGWGFPCYDQRGRGDDEEFISIEYSDEYEGFAKKQYLVVAAIGRNHIIQPLFKKVKGVYKNAFVKKTSIYVGCMH